MNNSSATLGQESRLEPAPATQTPRIVAMRPFWQPTMGRDQLEQLQQQNAAAKAYAAELRNRPDISSVRTKYREVRAGGGRVGLLVVIGYGRPEVRNG